MGLPAALLLVDLLPALFLLVLGGWIFIGGAELRPAEEEILIVLNQLKRPFKPLDTIVP